MTCRMPFSANSHHKKSTSRTTNRQKEPICARSPQECASLSLSLSQTLLLLPNPNLPNGARRSRYKWRRASGWAPDTHGCSGNASAVAATASCFGPEALMLAIQRASTTTRKSALQRPHGPPPASQLLAPSLLPPKRSRLWRSDVAPLKIEAYLCLSLCVSRPLCLKLLCLRLSPPNALVSDLLCLVGWLFVPWPVGR